jgi:DNA-binding transcriptional MerR regulator
VRAGHMKIGEPGRVTGVSVRLLRYHEEQGLLTCERTAGGHRTHPADATAMVELRRVTGRTHGRGTP